MRYSDTTMRKSDARPDMTGVAARWLIGFLGSITLIFVLPRIVRSAVRHYAFRLIAEIIAIISFGLLAEKAVEWIERRPHGPSLDAPE